MQEIKESPEQGTQLQEQDAESTELVDKIETDLVENPVVLERLLDRPKVMALFSRTVFQGPLPPPSMLREYEEIVPGAAERIIERSEREQYHRHSVTEKAVDGAIGKDKRGQWMAFTITMVVLIIAAVFAWKGQTVFAGALVTIDLIGLASVFAIGRLIGPSPEKD